MSLDVLSELILAMPIEIDCLPSDDGARTTKTVGHHTVRVRERIQPVHGVLRHLDDNSRRNMFER